MESTVPIQLCVPTGVYPPDIGGPATYVPLLEKHLPPQGFSVDVLPFQAVRHLPKGISHLVYFFHCLRHALSANIVYAQDAISVGWPACLATLVTCKPFAVKIVGDHVWEQGRMRFGVTKELDDFPFWPAHPYLIFLRLLQQVVVRSARKVIVPSEYLKKVVMRWGVSEEKIAVIYNGIEIPVSVIEPKKIPPRPFIVSVGRLTSWKGFDGIIDAVKNEPWHVVIVGDGPLRMNLESYTRQMGMFERVHFTGLLPREEMHGWLKAADVFVLNSTYEGLPHVLIEAMALGTPVVATDIPGNHEVITNEREGVLVPARDSMALHNAIKKNLADPQDAHSVDAKKRAEVFSVEQSIEGLVHVLKSICAS